MTLFAEKFPGLAPMVVYSELGTPLATAQFTAHEQGAFYGLETLTPGIAGSLWSGVLTAAAIDPRVYTILGCVVSLY